MWFWGVGNESRDACVSPGVGLEFELAAEPLFGAVFDVGLDTVPLCLWIHRRRDTSSVELPEGDRFSLSALYSK